MAHTPGPWQIDWEYETHHHAIMIWGPKGAGWGGVCEVDKDCAESSETVTGADNARLIAVAPDLLKALKNCHAALLHHPDGDDRDEADILATVEAIAKAEGRESK